MISLFGRPSLSMCPRGTARAGANSWRRNCMFIPIQWDAELSHVWIANYLSLSLSLSLFLSSFVFRLCLNRWLLTTYSQFQWIRVLTSVTSVRLPWLLWLQTNQLTSIEHDTEHATEHDVEQRQRQLHSFFFLFSIKATQCSWLVRGNIKSVIISTSHREVPLCPIHITWLQFVWIHHEQWAWDLRSSSWSFYTEIVITMASTKINFLFGRSHCLCLWTMRRGGAQPEIVTPWLSSFWHVCSVSR